MVYDCDEVYSTNQFLPFNKYREKIIDYTAENSNFYCKFQKIQTARTSLDRVCFNPSLPSENNNL